LPEPATVQGLLALRDRIETGKRHAEIIEGRLIVSATPEIWHERACRWLTDSLWEACEERGWFTDRFGEIELPPTRDRIVPDLVILRDVASLPKLGSLRPLDHVLLVAEAISRSSIREDREVKPRACALAGVPLYILVDRTSWWTGLPARSRCPYSVFQAQRGTRRSTRSRSGRSCACPPRLTSPLTQQACRFRADDSPLPLT
jgi:Uma2 family endonuclease